MEQTKNLVQGIDPNNGRPTAHCEKGQPRVVYTIPFTKTAVAKVLKGEHPIGPDSINTTDPSKVIFYGNLMACMVL